jgi:hypothetical protein
VHTTGLVRHLTPSCQTEQPIDTSTAAGKCFLVMLGVFAEFETNLCRERQQGITDAKARGVYKGRKASIEPAKLWRAAICGTTSFHTKATTELRMGTAQYCSGGVSQKISVCEIFGVVQFSTFATQSAGERTFVRPAGQCPETCRTWDLMIVLDRSNDHLEDEKNDNHVC